MPADPADTSGWKEPQEKASSGTVNIKINSLSGYAVHHFYDNFEIFVW